MGTCEILEILLLNGRVAAVMRKRYVGAFEILESGGRSALEAN